jgi:glycosyltransferase involved in cell wall biosynthesis
MAHLAGVEVRPVVPYDHVPSLLSSADVLLIPIDFDEASMRFMRLSMPTKIPDYMAAGRPVLTYAPRGSAVAEYAREGGWSLLVDEPDPDLVRDALTTLIDDRALRSDMGARARRLVVERHDGTVVRARFIEELARASVSHDR